MRRKKDLKLDTKESSEWNPRRKRDTERDQINLMVGPLGGGH